MSMSEKDNNFSIKVNNIAVCFLRKIINWIESCELKGDIIGGSGYEMAFSKLKFCHEEGDKPDLSN